MDRIKNAREPGRKPGQFEGRFLVAMPDMHSDEFASTIIYMCQHDEQGALGFVINRPATMTLADLLSHTEDDEAQDLVLSPLDAATLVREGGPVDTHRGFVLHTPDYVTSSTMDVGSGLALTSTINVLKAIASGRGPEKSIVLLGYAGWGAAQLEHEMRDNAWLVIDSDMRSIFDNDHAGKYERALGAIGINASNFISDAGQA